MKDINLIPVARLMRKRQRARLCLWGLVCGIYTLVIVGGSVTVHVVHAGESRSVTERLQMATNQVEEGNRAMLDLRRQLAEAAAKAQTTRAIQGQPDWSKLLAGLSAQLGRDIVLSRCQLTTQTADKKVVTAEGSETLVAMPLGTFLTGCRRTLVLTGYGRSQESVSQFVLRLEGSGVFDLVRLVSSSRQSFLKSEAVAFTVECHL